MILKGYADHHWSTTTFNTVGLAVKNAILAPAKTANRYLFVESFRVSQKGVLSTLETLTKTKWNVSYHDAEKEKQLALERLSQGNHSALPTLMWYVTCVEGYGGDYMKHEESANNLLSLPEETLDSALEKMVL